jgi:hypothetical protein
MVDIAAKEKMSRIKATWRWLADIGGAPGDTDQEGTRSLRE